MEATRRGFLAALAGAFASAAIADVLPEAQSDGLAPWDPGCGPYMFYHRAELSAVGEYDLLSVNLDRPFALRQIKAMLHQQVSAAATIQF